MKGLLLGIVAGFAVGAGWPAPAQTASAAPIVLRDATGAIAGRALEGTLVLVKVDPGGVVAPAFIRPLYDTDGRTASGIATWAGGGSVLFTSADCTRGAHIHTLSNAGLRASSQVETPDGTILYVGAIGAPVTIDVKAILYASGCSPVSVRQNGVVPVDASVNLTTTFPPPLAFQ